MSRMARKTMRGVPVRTVFLRTSAEPADDTEKLISSSMENPEDTKADPAHSHSHSKLPLGSQPVSHHDYSIHEINNVPAPIPDTGLPPPSADTTTLVTPQSSVALKPSASRSHEPSKPTFVPLPSLKTQNLTEIEEAAAHSSTATRLMPITRPVMTTTASSNSHDHGHQLNTSHLSTAAIIALVVSGGFTLFIVFVLAKLIKRPRRRRTPTPSLPILRDGAFPDKAENEGSPVFGGKERLSLALQERSAKGSTGLWPWTQYSSGIPKPAPMVTVTRSSSQGQHLTVNQATQQCGLGVVDNDMTYIRAQDQGQYPFTGYGNSNAISKTERPVPLQPVQNAITRAVSRLSTVSMSLYPNSSGGYSQVGADVGVAIGGVTHNEPGRVAVSRYKDRIMASHDRTSMLAPSSAKDAAVLRRSQSFAYGGIEATLPPTASANRGQLHGGRARIKSTYYTPGSYPRASAAATNYGKRDLDREQDGTQVERDRADGGDPQQGRDLASALGLISPIPPSPQPTLYPDDSMSMIGEAKKITLTGRSQKKPVPKASPHCDGLPSDTAALGSLMMVDFAASKSTASLINIRASEAARVREGQEDGGAVTGKSNLKKRVEDRAPRVPSPPPIPSLAQMAMQHADPEGYADYHSPTYSIYGLYDGDRKSRGLSYGYS